MDKSLNGEFVISKSTTNDTKEASPNTSSFVKSNHKSSLHFYSSFCKNPKGITFAEREEGEEILLLLRRHFITNFPWIFAAIFFVLLPLTFPFLATTLPFTLPSPNTAALFIGFYYLVLFGFVIVNFTLWYFHAGLITTHRLIDIDLHGILYRQISEAKNKNIEDVTYTQIGFVRSLFNYGDVMVQTAGAESNIEYDKVPKPSMVADIIGDLHS
ncbi:MAG: hypothetical protein Q7T54_04965 [Candidatus Levybacteria bacterium]|nr:hypothetical protein [Candidatus Levybacteria bacterium]